MTHADTVEIIATINRYALAVDSQSWDLFEQVFTPDVEADFGGGAAWKDLSALTGDFALIHKIFDATQHVTTNHNVRLDGDRAKALCYVTGRFIRAMPEGGNIFESFGWYDDVLKRTSSGWRISKRICRRIWASGNPQIMLTKPGIVAQSKLNSLARDREDGIVGFFAAETR